MARKRASKRGYWRILFGILVVCVIGCLAVSQLRIFARPQGLLGRLDVHYVIIDLSHGQYRVCPALATGGRSEPFRSMVDRLKPYAAICGTYYDPDWTPLGDVVAGGKVICRGGQRQGVGFTSDGKIRFLERHGHSRFNWSGCVSGIASGPRLVRAGEKSINVKRDGFTEAAATTKAWRCAVGATADGKLILCVVSQSVTLSALAEVMLELGAKNAVNMDGGSMCALYESGKYLAEPIMPMSNILAVYEAK